jgi:HEPN domain-containing protein
MRSPTEDWINSARSDVETMREIVSNEGLTHVVAFHAQQCIETKMSLSEQ